MIEKKPFRRANNNATTAVALHYDGADAPRVIAKGRHLIAEKILALAKEHDIPLYDDPDLATLLSRLELGEKIPATLYAAVAEVIAFAYAMRGKATNRNPS